MKKFTVLTSVMIGITAILLLAGCKDKTALSVEDFSSKGEANGCIVIDNPPRTDELESAAIATHPDGWRVEFYIFKNEDVANDKFDTAKEVAENSKGSFSKMKSASIKNYSSYTLSSDGHYTHICRVDNTVLYVRAKEENKDNVKKLIEELGY